MKYKNYIFITLLLIISYQVISNSQELINCVIFSIDLWKNNIFPSLFLFFIISNLLINYGITNIFNYIFNPLMRLFRININCSTIFGLSIITGSPSNAVNSKKLLDNGLIDYNDITKILLFTHFVNPLFILGYISSCLNKKLSILILVSHYLGNIIISFIFRTYYSNYNRDLVKNKIEQLDIGNCISKSIKESIGNLLSILGSIIIFGCLSLIIKNLFNLNNNIYSFISGLFEISNGVKMISLLNISNMIKTIIITFIISFGGLAIHLQVFGIVSYKVKYKIYFLARLLHGLIASILVLLFYNLI